MDITSIAMRMGDQMHRLMRVHLGEIFWLLSAPHELQRSLQQHTIQQVSRTLRHMHIPNTARMMIPISHVTIGVGSVLCASTNAFGSFAIHEEFPVSNTASKIGANPLDIPFEMPSVPE